MRFNNLKNITALLSVMYILSSCHKKDGVHADYWVARQAGAYAITEIKHVKYQDNTIVEEGNLLNGESTFILKSQEGEEGTTYYVLDIYGSYVPSYLNKLNTGFGWVLEFDNKRMSFGCVDPSIGFVPAVTLTVDDMTKKRQKWHYIKSYNIGGKDVYEHDTYYVERK